MCQLNRKILCFLNIKKLMANNTVYEMCDDHDLHCNDTNKARRDA